MQQARKSKRKGQEKRVEANQKVFSFFSGVGLLDLGFEDRGFKVEFVNEIERQFLDAYRHSRAMLGRSAPRFGWSSESIDYFLTPTGSAELASYVREAKKTKGSKVGFIGGPPCPDFSVGGKNAGSSGENGKLSSSYIKLICEQKPDWFLFENVKGLWKTKKHRLFYEGLKKQLVQAGYLLTEQLVNSIEFGVPQDRYRILLFGVLKSGNDSNTRVAKFNWNAHKIYPNTRAFEFDWPQTTPVGIEPDIPDAPEKLTINWWFQNNEVMDHPNTNNYFTPRAGLPKFQSISEGDVSRKSYKRLHRWRYSPTAAYGNNEVHIHPFEARRISAAEALAIQSAPRDFELPISMTLSAMFKTIGNGVPYLLAAGIAQTISDFLNIDEA